MGGDLVDRGSDGLGTVGCGGTHNAGGFGHQGVPVSAGWVVEFAVNAATTVAVM